MRKALFVAILVATACLAMASTAAAHYITTSSLTCQGLKFSGADFPQGDNKFVLHWWDGTTQTIDGWTGSNGIVNVGPIPLPEIPANGTDVSVVGTWTADGGGSFDVSQTLSCQPVVTTPSIDCSGLHFSWTSNLPSPTFTVYWGPTGWGTTTVPQTGHSGTTTVPLPATPPNGTVVTAVLAWPGGSESVSSTPMSCIPPTPTPPTPTPPTPTPPTPTPPTPPTPTPPTPTPPKPPKHHHPVCVKVPAKKVHASIGPQRLRTGNAILRASSPSSISKINVEVLANGHMWSKTFSGHNLTLPLDVASTTIWGIDKHCGCTYSPNARVVVTFLGKCSRITITLPYNNQDPLRRRVAKTAAASWS